MTLIVYKNKMVAADRRGTIVMPNRAPDKYGCAHCGKKGYQVDDDSEKIFLWATRLKPIVFREEKILSVAAAGNNKFSSKFIKLLCDQVNIEEAYKTYLFLRSVEDAKNHPSSTLLLNCEKSNYVVDIIGQGPMNVKQFQLDQLITIGSSTSAAAMIDKLMPDLTAYEIINLVMAKDDGIGGDVDYIDFNQPELKIERFERRDPQTLVQEYATAFVEGKKAIAGQVRKT